MGKILRKKRKLGKRGFTLIELIVVIAIIAVLAIVGIPAISGQVVKAQQSVCEDTLALINSTVGIMITEMETKGMTVDQIINSPTLNMANRNVEVCKRAGIDPKKFDRLIISISSETTVYGTKVAKIAGVIVQYGKGYADSAAPTS